jgi:hypothetical protein
MLPCLNWEWDLGSISGSANWLLGDLSYFLSQSLRVPLSEKNFRISLQPEINPKDLEYVTDTVTECYTLRFHRIGLVRGS